MTKGTPRRFSKVGNATPAQSKTNFPGCHAGGSTENSWSAPLATEMVMVSMQSNNSAEPDTTPAAGESSLLATR